MGRGGPPQSLSNTGTRTQFSLPSQGLSDGYSGMVS